jgi:hypothetical protein
MTAAPPPPSSVPNPPAASPSPSLSRYLFRPGSIEKSTSLWWTIPPAIAWICLAAGALLAHAIDASPSLANPIQWILFVDLVATSFWMVLVVLSQREKDTEVRDGLIDPKGRHEYWRVRTLAWDLLAISIVGALLDAFLLAGPSAILPTTDVPLVELAVLILTILLLATFSRYAAMAFNTDAARMVQKLDELSTRESEARTRDTDRITRLFTEQTDRIVAKADAQIDATTTGLSAATEQLDRVAQAIEDLTNVERESKSATQAADEAQRRAAEEQRRLAIERKADETRVAAERVDLIRPGIWIRIRVRGVLTHHLMVEVYNDGFDGVGLEVTVLIGQGHYSFSETRLSSKIARSFEVGDVAQFPLMAQIGVGVVLRDVDGHQHRYAAGPFNYARVAGWLNRTKSLSINPHGWIVAAVLI